jgi:chlorite dismutase
MDSQIKIMMMAYRLSGRFWKDSADLSQDISQSLDNVQEDLRKKLIHFQSYSSMRSDSDFLFWFSSRKSEDLVSAKRSLNIAFKGYGKAVYSMFAIYEHSPYARDGRTLEDTLRMPPKKYFIAYPMIKHPEWYLEPAEERKKIMSEHISMAMNDPENSDIRSYTTYSYGIGDQEFIVMYETDSLEEWSHVTQRLREARQRKWITTEYPIYVGIHQDSLKI